jgi:selenocysteine lyase/cysteine desulfurase
MASVRAGAVRVGFHLYNTEDDLQRLLDALAG